MVDLALINWLRDGYYRIEVLRLLKSLPDIPTNISKKLELHKSSLSRILNDLYNKKLIEKVTSDSRTITYKISALGEEILKEFDKKNGSK
jgi:DNA-binding MarR family transcriptional regulator